MIKEYNCFLNSFIFISFGMDEVLDLILSHLTSVDLRLARLVSLGWLRTVERLTLHREGGRLGWGWREGEPGLARLQCSKERSVTRIIIIVT